MKPKTPGTAGEESPQALLLARTEELERLNEKLQGLLNDERRISEELRQGNVLKDEFLSLVAHELRAPLTTILGNASILLNRRSELDAESIEQALGDILSDARRQERLIRNLIVLARPEQENQPAHEPVELLGLITEAIEDHRRRFPDRQIQLIADSRKLIAAGHSDSTEEILNNFLSNAEKYSPPEDAIEIGLHRQRNEIEVSVMDRGPGVAKDEVDSIFEPFFRSENTSSTASGLGLGLAVCRRLIERQGGRIWVKPREGGGSHFGITLPVYKQP
jgi:two-component system, OmpR family, sensor histidine kinase KdpD